MTGEGRLDGTSLSGKAVGEVALRALRAGVPCHAVVGSNALETAAGSRFASITEAGDPDAIARSVREISGF